jgi:hypothetical protein
MIGFFQNILICLVDLPMPEHYVYAQGVFAVLAKTPFVNKSRQFLTSQRHNLSGAVQALDNILNKMLQKGTPKNSIKL